MRVLITGGSGALGTSLKKKIKNAFFPTHEEIDITSADAVNKTILSYKPNTLIHTAALVSIRGCEENKQKAWLTNIEGTQNIVNAFGYFHCVFGTKLVLIMHVFLYCLTTISPHNLVSE